MSIVNKIRLPAMPLALAPPEKEPDPAPELDDEEPADDNVNGSYEKYDKISEARGSYENYYYKKNKYKSSHETGSDERCTFGNSSSCDTDSGYGDGWGNYDKPGRFKGSFGRGSHEKGNFDNSGFGKGDTNKNDFDNSGGFGKDNPTKQAWEQGWEKGLSKGWEKGWEKGLSKGLAQGVEKGFGKGRSQGIAQGRKQAQEELGSYVWVKMPKHFLHSSWQQEE